MTGTRLRSATVIGCGVIGTSIALALTRAGVDVALADLRPEPVALAARMGAGTALARSAAPADVVVVATPAHAVVEVLYEAQARGLGRAYTDVAGPKGPIWEEALLRGCDLLGWVPGHPVAGRELSGGPGAARADLLTGRPWILCPVPTTASDHLAAVEELVAQCGAVRHEMPPAVHDQAVASLSRPPLTVPATLAAPQVCAAPQPPALANGTRPTTTRTVGSHAGSEGGNLTRRVEAAAVAASRVITEAAALDKDSKEYAEAGVPDITVRPAAGEFSRAAGTEARAARPRAKTPVRGGMPAGPAPLFRRLVP